MGLSFLLPGFCGVAVFSLLPFMDVIRRSFVQAVSGRFCGLENYRIVLHNRAFLLAVKIRCGFFWYVCHYCWGFL